MAGLTKIQSGGIGDNIDFDGEGTLVLDSTNNRVGIGTSSPSNLLDIEGNTPRLEITDTAGTGNAARPGVFMRDSDATNLFFIGSGATTDSDLTIRNYSSGGATSLWTANTERARIDSAGRVGIGSGSQDLSVFQANGSQDLVVYSRGTSGLNAHAGITLLGQNTTASQCSISFADGAAGAQRYAGSIDYFHGTDSMSFRTNGIGRMRVDSIGRLILNNTTVHGTSSRSSYYSFLHIRGNTSSADSDGRINLTSNHAIQTNGNLGSIYFSDKNGGDRALIRANMSAAGNSTDNFPGYLTFWTNGGSANPTERMRIDGSGRVLIGQSDLTGINAEADNFVISANNPTGMTIKSADGGNCNINFADAGDDDVGRIRYNHSSDQLEFYTSTNHQWNITNNGDLKTTSIDTAGSFGFGVENGKNGFITIQRGSPNGGSSAFLIYQGTSNTVKMLANGTCSKPGGGSWSDINSERRLKQNLTLVDPTTAWETIRDLPYYSYSFIADPDELTHYGPVVDECPADMQVTVYEENEEGVQVVRSDEEGPLRTYDNQLRDARLFVALQEALKRIETLEAEVAALKAV